MESTIEKQKNYPKDQDWVYCKDKEEAQFMLQLKTEKQS
jgi:hypothetical protein